MSDPVETLERLHFRLREQEQQCALLRAERDQLLAALRGLGEPRPLLDSPSTLSTLAAGVAHEFNNLLTSIMGYTSLSLAELTPGAPAQEYLGRVLASARRAAELCQQMLAYAGQGRFQLHPLDLNDFLRPLIVEFREAIVARAELVVDLAPDLARVEADPSLLRQVVFALVQNAIEALPVAATDGLVNLRTDRVVDPEGLPAGDYVQLEVADTGCGMDAETLRRAFEPFFTTKFMGRGLGLAAVQGIVRSHGGVVRASSSAGQGSCFRVLLPALAPTREPSCPTLPLP